MHCLDAEMVPTRAQLDGAPVTIMAVCGMGAGHGMNITMKNILSLQLGTKRLKLNPQKQLGPKLLL